MAAMIPPKLLGGRCWQWWCGRSLPLLGAWGGTLSNGRYADAPLGARAGLFISLWMGCLFFALIVGVTSYGALMRHWEARRMMYSVLPLTHDYTCLPCGAAGMDDVLCIDRRTTRTRRIRAKET